MFMGYISHEIRTHLNVVYMGLLCLKEEGGSSGSIDTIYCMDCAAQIDAEISERSKLLEDVMGACHEGIRVLDRFVTYDGLQTGTQQLNKVLCNICSIVESSVHRYQKQVSECLDM